VKKIGHLTALSVSKGNQPGCGPHVPSKRNIKKHRRDEDGADQAGERFAEPQWVIAAEPKELEKGERNKGLGPVGDSKKSLWKAQQQK